MSGRSPPPVADSELIAALKTSGSVVLISGPKSGVQVETVEDNDLKLLLFFLL